MCLESFSFQILQLGFALKYLPTTLFLNSQDQNVFSINTLFWFFIWHNTTLYSFSTKSSSTSSSSLRESHFDSSCVSCSWKCFSKSWSKSLIYVDLWKICTFIVKSFLEHVVLSLKLFWNYMFLISLWAKPYISWNHI